MLFGQSNEFVTIGVVGIPYYFVDNPLLHIWKLNEQFQKVAPVNDSKIAIGSGFDRKGGMGAECYLSISNQYSIQEFAKEYSLS